jgi:phosphodiesterase/alkaline phosphatase D-like protein
VGAAGQVIAYSPFVAGSVDPANPPGWNTSHRVDLTGLMPNTTYVWRVRTRDAFRNETHTALGTFRTVDPAGPPAPVLVHEPDQYN